MKYLQDFKLFEYNENINESKIIEDILSTNESISLDKLKNYAKKGIITASLLTSLLSSSNISAQEKVKDDIKIERSDDNQIKSLIFVTNNVAPNDPTLSSLPPAAMQAEWNITDSNINVKLHIMNQIVTYNKPITTIEKTDSKWVFTADFVTCIKRYTIIIVDQNQIESMPKSIQKKMGKIIVTEDSKDSFTNVVKSGIYY